MRRLLIGGLLVVAACGTIGSPLITSTDVYEFRDLELGDTTVFHWKRTDLPVRVWVASDSPIRQYVETAISRWENAFLYGEFSATMVTDSTKADVIVRNSPPDVGGGIHAFAPECTGETDPDIDPVTKTATLPMHVYVYPATSLPGAGLATCYSITVTHEFGHVLGIINSNHAGTNSGDVMFGNPVFDGISNRDRLTANTLYLVAPNVTITGRR